MIQLLGINSQPRQLHASPARRAHSALQVDCLTKSYGGTLALDTVSISLQEGTFACLLGPNGSGKSTLLKILAGAEGRTSGNINFRGAPLRSFDEFVLVWQSLALFPHMNVNENVGFGLAARRVNSVERRRRVDEILEKVGLRGYGRRKVHELSGGEQQRAALARALVLKPAVLLLDEPFGAIDIELRSQLQGLLRDIHKLDRQTIIMVTHDMSEAMALGETLIVMENGRLQQVGCPKNILQSPVNGMVARFVGNYNVFPGNVKSIEGCTALVETAAGEFSCQSAPWVDRTFSPGDQVDYAIDSSKVKLADTAPNKVQAIVESVNIISRLTVIRARTEGMTRLRCDLLGSDFQAASASEQVTLSWNGSDAVMLPRH